MALHDVATLNLSVGHFYTATTGTAAPDDFLAPGVGWTNIGHTSLDNIFSVSSSGGDTTTLGTLQATTLRTSTSARTETFSFNIAQWDVDSLKLYFGANAVYDADDNLLAIPDNPTPTEKAFLVVFIDGTKHFAFYAAKTEIIRGDDLSITDTTSLQTLNLRVTPLNHAGAQSKYSVSPILTTP